MQIRWFFLFVLLFNAGAAHAQDFYAFGPKKGQPIETEEQKQAEFRNQSLQQLQNIQELLKAQQDAFSQQLELLRQQNQLLTTVIELQQQQIQQQATQQLQFQQPATAPLQ